MLRRPALVLLGLTLVFVAVGLVEAWRDSPTVDEAVDVASGVTSLVRHDLRLNPEHGILFRLTADAPALFAHPIVPSGEGYRTDDWFAHTDAFMRANRATGRLHLIVFLARLVPLAEGAGVGWLLYLLGRRLFGAAAGAVAGGLWLTTPVVVGLSHVVSIDVAFTLAVVAVALALARHLDRPSTRCVLVVGVALGGALLVRHTALVLVPVAAAVVGGSASRVKVRRGLTWAAVTFTIPWLVVWAAIRGFVPAAPGGAAGQRLDGFIDGARGSSALARLVLAVPWPKEWAAGFGYLILTNTRRPAYLLGQAWVGSRWWFFPGSLLVKAPIPALAVLVLGPLGWTRMPADSRRKALVVVVLPGLAMFAALLAQPLDLGLRYAFAPLALWMVAAGPAAVAARHVAGRVVVVVVVGAQLAATAVAYPHSLAWTPPPFRPAYRVATDSNVDYGQDNGAVERWASGKTPFVDLLLPRGADPPPGSHPLLDTPVEEITGWVAVSATRLTELDRDRLSWLRAYCAVGTINGSVMLYRFATPPTPSPGPTMPAGLCHSSDSRRTAVTPQH